MHESKATKVKTSNAYLLNTNVSLSVTDIPTAWHPVLENLSSVVTRPETREARTGFWKA
jgi:hypothetical protein